MVYNVPSVAGRPQPSRTVPRAGAGPRRPGGTVAASKSRPLTGNGIACSKLRVKGAKAEEMRGDSNMKKIKR